MKRGDDHLNDTILLRIPINIKRRNDSLQYLHLSIRIIYVFFFNPQLQGLLTKTKVVKTNSTHQEAKPKRTLFIEHTRL